MDPINENIRLIQQLCKQHKVLNLFVFGSALTDKFTPESDIDLLVEFDDVDLKNYADNYFNLKYSLQDLFHRQVDLLENKALKNPFLKQTIDASKKLIYG